MKSFPHNAIKQKRTPLASAGFTLLEMMVTLAIFVILTGIILANEHRLSNTLTLSSLAYDISLSVRQAQTYGYAVKGSTGTDPFQNSFGIHFDPGHPTAYEIFTEGILTGGSTAYQFSSDKTVQTYSLQNGYAIVDVCSPGISSSDCSLPYSSGRTLDIMYVRPSSNAIINMFDNSGNLITGAKLDHARVEVQSPDLKTKWIDVYESGQISVADN